MEYLQYDDEELEFQREQFTFYRSFYESMLDIEDREKRADTYDMICAYALNNMEPDMNALLPIQRNTLRLIMPVLKSGKKKALAGMKHGKAYPGKKQNRNKQGTNKEQTGNKGEIEKEIEKEIEIETQTEGEGAVLPNAGGGGFDIFWNYFPKKVCKEQARQEFSKVDVSLQVLLTAIRKQQESIQWIRENGRYIPNPATWLAERRWEDELPAVQGGELKASGRPGEAELAAIHRMLIENE